MRKNVSIPGWLFYTLIGTSIGLSIWALCVANSSVWGLEFDSDKLIALVGLFFTVMGVVFTVYFVIIGIDAHKIDKEIAETKKQIEKELKIIECNNLDKIYGQSINIAKTISDEKVRTRIIRSLRLENARLASQSRFLNDETRRKRLPDLIELGTVSDIDDLTRIINDPTEEEIMDLAKSIKIELIEKMKERLKEEQLRGLNALS